MANFSQPESKTSLLKRVDGLRGESRLARKRADTAMPDEERTSLLKLAGEKDREADRLEKAAIDAKEGVLAPRITGIS